MSEIWERRMSMLIGLTIVTIGVWAFYGLLAAFGIGAAMLLGHHFGRHEADDL